MSDPLHQAIILLQQGRYDPVLELCRMLLQRGSDPFSVHHLSGVALLRLDRLAESEQALRQACRSRAPRAQRPCSKPRAGLRLAVLLLQGDETAALALCHQIPDSDSLQGICSPRSAASRRRGRGDAEFAVRALSTGRQCRYADLSRRARGAAGHSAGPASRPLTRPLTRQSNRHPYLFDCYAQQVRYVAYPWMPVRERLPRPGGSMGPTWFSRARSGLRPLLGGKFITAL